jgi:hypothetical protein
LQRDLVEQMIHQLVFAGLPDSQPVGTDGWGRSPSKIMHPWKAIKKTLEGTGDHILWIVTKQQLHSFLLKIKEEKLVEYLVVKHDDMENSGTTNRNHTNDPRRLKVFIMKGAK